MSPSWITGTSSCPENSNLCFWVKPTPSTVELHSRPLCASAILTRQPKGLKRLPFKPSRSKNFIEIVGILPEVNFLTINLSQLYINSPSLKLVLKKIVLQPRYQVYFFAKTFRLRLKHDQVDIYAINYIGFCV